METLKLPTSDFRWLSPGETRRMNAESILKIAPQEETGYAFEVDLTYPADLHEVGSKGACVVVVVPRLYFFPPPFLHCSRTTISRWRLTPARWVFKTCRLSIDACCGNTNRGTTSGNDTKAVN